MQTDALFHMDPEPRPGRETGTHGRWAGKLSADARAIVRAMLPGPCWRCGKHLDPESADWTAGHIIDRMDGGDNGAGNLAPECKHCNYSAGGRRGAAITNLRHTERTDIPRMRRPQWF